VPGYKPHKIEVLADGQQWVAYHIHPDTGRAYHWPEGELPAREELPELTREKAALFLERAEAAIVAWGGRIKPKLRERGPSSEEHKPSPLGQAGTREAIADALEAIPNADLPYDDWLEIGLAIKGALGEEGRDLWEDWSAEAKKKNDPEVTAKFWDGFEPRQIGAGTIYHAARRNGWKPTPTIALNPEKAKAKKPREQVRTAAPATAPAAAGGRSEIRLSEEFVNDVARQCAGLLRDEVFLRGTMAAVLVRAEDAPGVSDGDNGESEDDPGVLMDGVRHPRGALVFAEPSPERIQFRLDDRARFLRFDARSEKLVAKSCPAALARRIIGAAAELGFRPCAGIVTTPLFVRGRIVAERGYHPPTGLVLDYRDELPAVPEKPTRRQVRRAAVTLLRPFRGYLAGLDNETRPRLRAAFLAAALTAVLRPSLPTAPAILLDANQPGAGKGKAARALAVISTGHAPSIITEGHSPEETEKRLASGVLSGTSALLLDNLQRTLASATLESILTEGRANIRLFGQLTGLTVSCSALVLITANNAAIGTDMLRRVLPVRIVVATDRPELTQYDFEPYAEAKRHRPAIIAAGLTIARAWWQARETASGKLISKKTLGSFEDWAALVAGAVEWVVGVNPITLIEERKTEDPRRGDERQVIEALAAWQGKLRDANGQPRTSWQAAEAAIGLGADLWAGILQFTGEHPSSRQVGKWLTRKKDAVLDKLMLTGKPDRNGVMAWTLRGLRGLAGFSYSQTRKCQEGGEGDKKQQRGAQTPPNPANPQTRKPRALLPARLTAAPTSPTRPDDDALDPSVPVKL
jgi:hypothetical protein